MSGGSPRRHAEWLALVVALLPVLAINVAYLLGAARDQIPQCMPYLDGCTSISSTGRHLPGAVVFKPAMLLQAALLLALWHITVWRLRALLSPPAPKLTRAVLVCGAISSMALVVYTLTLGSQLALYEFMRRGGIYFYFLGIVLTQLLATIAIRRTGKAHGMLVRAMFTVVALPFVLGLVNLVVKPFLADPDPLENAIEWVAALVMQAWYVLLVVAFRDIRPAAQPPR